MQRLKVTVGAEKEETALAFMALIQDAIQKVFDEYDGEHVVLAIAPIAERFSTQVAGDST